MRFLERSKTQHSKSGRDWPAGQQWPTRQDSTRRDLSIRKEHNQEDDNTARPSTSSVTSTQLKRRSSLPLRSDGIPLQAGPRIRLRPNTAEGDDKARVSFFEAFKIDAGEDFFAFPKPSSNGKTPPLIDFSIASPTASSEVQSPAKSPLIGIAIGSPSHPTTEWTTLMPASAKSSIVSPRILEIQHSPSTAPSTLQTSFTTQTQQESAEVVTPETPERKKSSWKNIFRRPSKPVKSQYSPIGTTTTPAITSPDSSTALHNKPQRLRASSRAMERIDLEARLASTSPPAKKNSFAPTNPLALNPPTPKFANTPAFASPPTPEEPSLRDRQPLPTKKLTVATAENATPSKQLPRAPLPAVKQLNPSTVNRPITHRPAMATGVAVPRLNLVLPSYQMERYSVMFEGVLDAKPSSAPPTTQQRNQPTSSKSSSTSPIDPSPQSALLERRKSRLRMLDVPSSHRPVPLQDQTQLSAITPVKSAALPVRQLKSEAFLPRQPSTRVDHAVPARSESTIRTKVFHKPLPLQRSNTSPLPRKSPVRTYFQNIGKRQDTIPPQNHTFDSPVSADDEDMSFPDTPPPMSTSPAMIPDVHVVTDYYLPSVTTESSEKDDLSAVWHSVLPTAPASSTSSRFSVDIHRAMESPDTPLSRSKSIDTTATRAFIHKVQVATARRINMSRAQHDAIATTALSKQPLRPMLVNVNASYTHSRETSMQEAGSVISA